ncbi:MAG: NTP transferase domain-containing protein [Ignavibacteria bacterium]|jgi:CTP:molybdopterin cytidylyltransferase MocA
MNISALILAAGSGKRIGKPKLMLELEGKSFLNIITEKIKSAGINNIICVVSKSSCKWAKDNVPEIEYAINPNPEDGMISSVFYGMQKINKCDGVMVTPVDHPFVYTGTYKLILNLAEQNPGCIIKPKYNGISGHPIVIPFEMKNIILQNKFSNGLDSLIKKSVLEHRYIDVEDNGVIKNINTKEDL